MAKAAKYTIGIDIGTNAVKVASYHVQRKKTALSVLMKYDFLQQDIVKEIKEVNETHVMAAVKQMLNELPYKRASIRVGITADYHNIFSLQVPQVAQHELKQTLFWELTPLLPEPVDHYEYDYAILPQTTRKKLNILLAVLKKVKMDWLNKLFKSLGTQMDILETTSLPAVDLFMREQGKLTEAVGFLQLGASHSSYILVDPKAYPEFLHIPFGGNLLNNLIADDRDIPFSDAEFLRLGIMGKVKAENEDDPESVAKAERESQINRSALYMENEEIGKALKKMTASVEQVNARHAYQTNTRVEKIYVTGGLLNDEFISKFFRFSDNFFDIPTEMWDPIETHFPHIEAEPMLKFQFGPAIGLAMR